MRNMLVFECPRLLFSCATHRPLTSRPGQSNLLPSCPVCEHSPLSAEDCNPNKSLRTTIKVFLRTAEKKREASRPKETTAAEPAEETQPPGSKVEHSASAVPQIKERHSGVQEEVGTHATDDVVPERAQQNEQVRLSKRCTYGYFPRNQLTLCKADISVNNELAARADFGGVVDSASAKGGVHEPRTANEAEARGENEAEEVDDQAGNDDENYGSESMNGGISNMMFSGSGDFNQMQMMMAMQNGMGNFPMMGMFLRFVLLSL